MEFLEYIGLIALSLILAGVFMFLAWCACWLVVKARVK